MFVLLALGAACTCWTGGFCDELLYSSSMLLNVCLGQAGNQKQWKVVCTWSAGD